MSDDWKHQGTVPPIVSHESLIERQAQQLQEWKDNWAQFTKNMGDRICTLETQLDRQKAAANCLAEALEAMDKNARCRCHEGTGFCHRCEVSMALETFYGATKPKGTA